MSDFDECKIEAQINLQRDEALENLLLVLPQLARTDASRLRYERAIECIVSAAILEVTLMIAKGKP